MTLALYGGDELPSVRAEFVELSRAGQLINNATFEPFKVFLTVAAIYFVICFPLSQLSRRLERRLHVAGTR